MRRPAIAAAALLLLAIPVIPQAQQTGFTKQNVYGAWSRTSFADASVITGPTRLIFLAGMASEDPNDGTIQFQGNFLEQCRMAYGKIRHRLEEQGAGMADIVRLTAYVTDARYRADYARCRGEALGDAPPPPHTFLTVSQLAWPGMLVEVEATAAVAAR